MPIFVDYLIACRAVEEKEATEDQLAVKKLYKTVLPAMKEEPTGAMSRLFDGAIPAIQVDDLKQLYRCYCRLLNMLKSNPASPTLQYQLDLLALGIYRNCAENILDVNGEVQKDLASLLELDKIKMHEQEKKDSLIMSYAHCLMMRLASMAITSLRDGMLKIYGIKTKPEGFLQAIFDANNAAATEAAMAHITNETYIEKETIESRLKNGPAIKSLIDKYEIPGYMFLDSYIQKGHTKAANRDFMRIVNDPTLLNEPLSALFKKSANVVGDNILAHIKKYHTELLFKKAVAISGHLESYNSEDLSARCGRVLQLAGVTVTSNSNLSPSSASKSSNSPKHSS